MKRSNEKHIYRVYVRQVNQTVVYVRAESKEEARELGYAKWRKNYAHSNVIYVDLAPDQSEAKR